MIKIITHTDLDGSGCAIVAKYFFGDRIEVTHADYNNLEEVVNNILQRMDEYEMIYFTDICPEEEDVIKLSKFGNIHIFDHHKSRAEFADKYDIIHLELSECGTKLFYEYLISQYGEDRRNDKLEKFVDLVDRYDRWVEDDPEKKKQADDLNAIFYFYGPNWFENKRGYDPHQDVLDRERFILQVLDFNEEFYIKRQLKKVEPLRVGNKLFALSFATKSTSKVANAINKIGVYDGVVMPEPTLNTVTLYSHSEDVSVIATKLGGGGHPGAAGFTHDFKSNIKEILAKLLEGVL